MKSASHRLDSELARVLCRVPAALIGRRIRDWPDLSPIDCMADGGRSRPLIADPPTGRYLAVSRL